MKHILFALVLSFVVVGCGTSNSNPPEQSKEPQYPIAGRWQSPYPYIVEDSDWEKLDTEPPEYVITTIEVIDSSTLRFTNSADTNSLELAVLYDNEEHTIGTFVDPEGDENITFSILGSEKLMMQGLTFTRIK